MKKILLTAAMCLASCTIFAQKPLSDTLMTRRIEAIQWSLNKSHEVYKLGIKIQLTGIGIAAAGLILAANKEPLFVSWSIGSIGTALALTGWSITIYSHKYIGRAGLVR